MLSRWIPWNYLIKAAARRYGLIDPLTLLARLRHFAQPSEVLEPIELLRAGIVFHARGLINTRAIQHNLDWVWPYWVVKQFDPRDPSFIPRAFSFTHINLTQRNWTTVGCPDLPIYPIVDPRGLLTPLHDGWSLDAWLITTDGRRLFPSQLPQVDQEWRFKPDLAVVTTCRLEDLGLRGRIWLECWDTSPQLRWQLQGSGPPGSALVISLRPYNPEGIEFVETLRFDPKENCLLVNDKTGVRFSHAPARLLFANYAQGDVSRRLDDAGGETGTNCKVGMATAAVIFPLDEQPTEPLEVFVDLRAGLDKTGRTAVQRSHSCNSWPEALAGSAQLNIPHERFSFLYTAAVRTLTLLSAGEVVPGPYTYNRFWFRDACLMLNAMLCLGLEERARRCLDSFPVRQKLTGYFCSQEGEWDSNGQVLWIIKRYLQLSGRPFPAAWQKVLWKGAEWILRKRLAAEPATPHAGLLPPGFSAEHFGPNDYYYWDDFWGVAGLQAAAKLADRVGETDRAAKYATAAAEFSAAVWRSIAQIPEQRSRGAIPASPYRRLDSGAIGCLAADYPLQLVAPGDSRVARTATFLQENCFVDGAFFQDMIHSGINPYLTLSVAQTLLRNGDLQYRKLVERVATLATPTGHWPEAIHPFSGGGCMGDGQHGWAAAEWVMILRNMFLREEAGGLILLSGIFPEWLQSSETLSFGPTPTPWGAISLRLFKKAGEHFLELNAVWRGLPPPLEARLPGYRSQVLEAHRKPQRMILVSA
ncbi:hypothetical protein [Geopsychrobacter electrodiphilus]|uniref:hypothetical protein n=1 Tax=Geopsychrobacter electrodiphilus TaxID=225196 RepID=UPI0003745C99|nr:hypothetical protein [Geopsychrobacter electrodiphilus]